MCGPQPFPADRAGFSRPCERRLTLAPCSVFVARMARSLLLLFLCVACGGAKPAATTPETATKSTAPAVADNPEPADSKESEPQKDGSAGVPTACASQRDGMCLPDGKFVTRLCQGNYPSVALALFRKSSPFTRGYLTRKTRAWNASGGASDAGELEFDEEVLVLRHRASDMGGMQVSGAMGGYDAIRWSGSCVTLASEELTLKLPPKAKTSKVEWRFLDTNLQEALRTDPKVDSAYIARRQECKGATMGTVSAKCEKADAKLSEAIVEYVRGGGEVPPPEKLP